MSLFVEKLLALTIGYRKYNVKSAYFFTNGKALFFDHDGNQIGHLQSLYHNKGYDAISHYITHKTSITKDLNYFSTFHNTSVWRRS